jgi:hypothetical protein
MYVLILRELVLGVFCVVLGADQVWVDAVRLRRGYVHVERAGCYALEFGRGRRLRRRLCVSLGRG